MQYFIDKYSQFLRDISVILIVYAKIFLLLIVKVNILMRTDEHFWDREDWNQYMDYMKKIFRERLFL